MFRKKVRDYKKPEMLRKFTSKNGRILSLNYTNISIWKKIISKFLKKVDNLKLDPQNIELKAPIKNRIFQSKNAYSPNARNSYSTYKNSFKNKNNKKVINL